MSDRNPTEAKVKYALVEIRLKATKLQNALPHVTARPQTQSLGMPRTNAAVAMEYVKELGQLVAEVGVDLAILIEAAEGRP